MAYQPTDRRRPCGSNPAFEDMSRLTTSELELDQSIAYTLLGPYYLSNSHGSLRCFCCAGRLQECATRRPTSRPHLRPQSCDLSCELARNTSSQTVGESFDTQSTVQPYDVRDNARRRDSAPGRGGSTASDRHAGTGALQCIVCIGAARNRIPARGAYPARATSDPVPVRVFWGRSGAAREVHPIRRIAICIHPISCAYLRARPRAIFGISRASRVAVLDFIYFTTLYLLSELVPYVEHLNVNFGPNS